MNSKNPDQKLPAVFDGCIIQYDEGVFVLMDEAHSPVDVRSTLEEARRAKEAYFDRISKELSKPPFSPVKKLCWRAGGGFWHGTFDTLEQVREDAIAYGMIHEVIDVSETIAITPSYFLPHANGLVEQMEDMAQDEIEFDTDIVILREDDEGVSANEALCAWANKHLVSNVDWVANEDSDQRKFYTFDAETMELKEATKCTDP